MSITRRGFLSAAALAAANAQEPGAAVPAQRVTGRKRPNLILYVPDELRAESIGCYGNATVKTPNIDRLASEGVRFEQCHVQNPVCGPSRCCFATGWPVHVHGHRSLYYALHPDEPNIFKYLKESGYDVYWFGKNDLLATETFASSVTHAESRGDNSAAYGKIGASANPYSESDSHFYTFVNNKLPDRRATSDYLNMQAAIEVLERKSDKPFCIFLPLTFPHVPYAAPEDFHDMYQTASLMPLRPTSLPRQPRYYNALRKIMRLDQLHDEDFRKVQALYLGMISYADWVLGEFLSAIERTGHTDDTAFFLFSDHGDWAGDYGLVEKWPNAMTDVLTRVPLIVRLPGQARGHVSKEMVEQYDVMATCLELAGIEANHTHFARSLMPQLHGSAGDVTRAAFCEAGYNINEPECFEPLSQFDPSMAYYPKVALQNQQPDTVTRTTSIRTLQFRLIYRPDDQSELYDLRADPRELNNVYGNAKYRDAQAELFRRVMDYYVRTSGIAPRQRDPRDLPH
jgi:arylsulfatase A-like enzyme